MSKILEKLQVKWNESKPVCVGLDSNPADIPVRHLGLGGATQPTLLAQEAYREMLTVLLGEEDGEFVPLSRDQNQLLGNAMLAFNRQIIDATKDLVCAYKTNSAPYESVRSHGLWARDKTLSNIRYAAPDVVSILDFKRGDIRDTNVFYMMAAMSCMVDAVTVHPYMGQKSLRPFLDLPDLGVFVLCKTSGLGDGEFQDLPLVVHDNHQGSPVTVPQYQRVASAVAGQWNGNGNCGVVAGATYPKEIERIREIIGDEMTMLLPGFGKQKADAQKALIAARNSKEQGVIANLSRSVIFASDGIDFAEAARAVVLQKTREFVAILAS